MSLFTILETATVDEGTQIVLLDAEAWVAAIEPEEDVTKRVGEILALSNFVREQVGMPDLETMKREHDKNYYSLLASTCQGMETARSAQRTKPSKRRAKATA
jgi:hypothetical protein